MSREASQQVLFDRLDFFTKTGERFATNLPQHLHVAPLAMQACGAKAAFDNAPVEH